MIDPIDGTSNFINGLPLFACSIGVLFHGRPIAGAIWCACSHALRPGTYHAAAHGPLKFDGRELTRRSQGSWRGLAGEPGGAPAHAADWDTMLYFPVPPAAAATLADRSEPLLIGTGAEIERTGGARNRSC